MGNYKYKLQECIEAIKAAERKPVLRYKYRYKKSALRHLPDKDRLHHPKLKVRVVDDVIFGVDLGQLAPGIQFLGRQIYGPRKARPWPP